MKKRMRLTAIALAGSIFFSGLAVPASAAIFTPDAAPSIILQTAYTPGVTVEQPSAEDLSGEYGAAYTDAGFKVTFTFCSDDTSLCDVSIGGNMNFYAPEDIAAYSQLGQPKGCELITAKSAYEYRAGMVTAQNDAPGLTGPNGILYKMEQVETGVWRLSLPLPAQQYTYKYILTFADGSSIQIADPANPLELGIDDINAQTSQSVLYVGSASSAPAEMNDFYPVKEKYLGTLQTASITASSGISQSLIIYLPYNYDPSKTYRTLYVSHGSNGSEIDWFAYASLKNILDNLYKDGRLTDLIVVTMDNNTPFNNLNDLEGAALNIMQSIVPYMEENYPVSARAEDRAVFGLSAGGSMTEVLLQTLPEAFSCVGISSVGRSFPLSSAAADPDAIRATSISYYCGALDWRVNSTLALYEDAESLGGDTYFKVLPGAHDWITWGLAIDDFLTNRLWSEGQANPFQQAYYQIRKYYTDRF